MKTYKGINIWEANQNCDGIRWVATVDGHNLKSDTLSGIRDLITYQLSLYGSYSF